MSIEMIFFHALVGTVMTAIVYAAVTYNRKEKE